MTHQRNVRDQAPVQAEAEFGAGLRTASRIAALAGDDPQAADLVLRMLGLAVRILPHAYLGGSFAFTLRPGLRPEGTSLRPEGTSLRPEGTSLRPEGTSLRLTRSSR